MVLDRIGIREWARLKLVGYANSLKDSMLPSVEAPVFQIEGTEDFMVPPAKGTELGFEGYIIDRAVYRELVLDERITEIPVHFEARPKHCLWIDEKRNVHYEPVELASKNLDELAESYLKKGRRLLEEKSIEDARLAFARSFGINTDCLEAIAGFLSIDFFLNPADLKNKAHWNLIYKLHARKDPQRAQILADSVERNIRYLEQPRQ